MSADVQNLTERKLDFNSTTPSEAEGNLLTRSVKWLRSPSEFWGDILLKVGAVALIILLIPLVIGLAVGIPMALEWYKQSTMENSKFGENEGLPASVKSTQPNQTEKAQEILETNFTLGKTTIEILQGDIEKQTDVEVIVNAANKALSGGSGVDGAIGKAAGESIYVECRALLKEIEQTQANPGEAFITKAGTLSGDIKHVIHTVGPHGSNINRKNLLRDCYYTSLVLANDCGLKSIAIPALSIGIFGYPPEEAAEVELKAVKEFCKNYPNTSLEKIRLVFWHDEPGFAANRKMMELCSLKEVSHPLNDIDKNRIIVLNSADKKILNDLISTDFDSLPLYDSSKGGGHSFPAPELVTAPIMRLSHANGGGIIIKLFQVNELDYEEVGNPKVFKTEYSYVVLTQDRDGDWIAFGPEFLIGQFMREGVVRPEQQKGFNLLKKILENGTGSDCANIPWTLSA